MKGSKYVKEVLYENEEDFFKKNRDVDDAQYENDTAEVMANVSQTLRELFQKAAENGLTFEMLQDLSEQALDEVDWVKAEQM